MFDRFQQRHDFQCSGRPQKLSPQARRYIYRFVRRSSGLSWKALVVSLMGSQKAQFDASYANIMEKQETYTFNQGGLLYQRMVWICKVVAWLYSLGFRDLFRRMFYPTRNKSSDESVFRFNFEAFRRGVVNLTYHKWYGVLLVPNGLVGVQCWWLWNGMSWLLDRAMPIFLYKDTRWRVTIATLSRLSGCFCIALLSAVFSLASRSCRYCSAQINFRRACFNLQSRSDI
jgi:hypothetical protein